MSVTTSQPTKRSNSRTWRSLIPQSNTAISGGVLVLVVIVMTVATNGLLLSPATLSVLATFAPEILLITIAMGFVLLIKEIDLSVGSIYVVSAVVFGSTYSSLGAPLWVCALIAIAAGGAMGMINGLLVVGTGVTAFIVTLGTMWAYRGLMLVSVGGSSISVRPDDGDPTLDILAGDPLGIPNQVLWLIVIVAVLVYLRNKTRLGAWMQATGSNERAVRMMGVPVKRVRVFVFTLSGVLCGIAGVFQVAHSNQAVPQSGDVVMLTALAGAIIGGVSLNGGRGGVLGPLFGGLTLRVIGIGLVMMGVIEYWTNVITAVAVILTAWAFMSFDRWRVGRK